MIYREANPRGLVAPDPPPNKRFKGNES